MRPLPCQPLLRCGLLSLAILIIMPARATDPAIPLPAWQVLEYEQQAFLITARSRVEINANVDNGQLWRLTANSSVASNSEQVVLDLAAADGRALYRSRLSKGKGERYKTYLFGPEQVTRERSAPSAGDTGPPGEWPTISRRDIPYPPLNPDMAVTDAYALLALADRFQASGNTSAEVVVYTDLNFYHVRLTHSDSPSIDVEFQVSGAPAVTGSRQTRAVTLQVSPLGAQIDKPDFSLLGLTGDITVLFDRSSGLPLQLRGKAPRIGNTKINLKAVTLRESPE